MLDEKNLNMEEEKKQCCCGENDKECNCENDHEGDHDCCCGHDHDHHHDGEEIEIPTVIMENEDGTQEELEIVEEFEYNGTTYILVQNEDETVTPLKVSGEEGALEFLSDEEFEEVQSAFSEFDEEDDDEDEEEEN